MILLRYYNFYCPLCSAVTARSFSKVLLGPPKAVCSACNNSYATGAREWVHMNGPEKREFLFPYLPQILIALPVIMIVVLALQFQKATDMSLFWFVTLKGMLYSSAPLIAFYAMRFVQIRKSMSRAPSKT